jgi:hypothetical protein
VFGLLEPHVVPGVPAVFALVDSISIRDTSLVVVLTCKQEIYLHRGAGPSPPAHGTRAGEWRYASVVDRKQEAI